MRLALGRMRWINPVFVHWLPTGRFDRPDWGPLRQHCGAFARQVRHDSLRPCYGLTAAGARLIAMTHYRLSSSQEVFLHGDVLVMRWCAA